MINFTKKTKAKSFICLLLLIFILTSMTGCFFLKKESEPIADNKALQVEEGQAYTSKEEVALYLHQYSKLPVNFITKKEASALGWKSSEGNLWQVSNQASIGGDTFGNREGLLPKEKGRVYYECDINYKGGFRGAERLVFSNDGLIYYTADHYETFTKLY